MVLISFNVFAEEIQAYEDVWLLGDNFMAKSYQSHFKKNEIPDMHLKVEYDYYPYCESKYSNKEMNMLCRIKASLARAIGERVKMPKFIIFILDDDIMRYLNYLEDGIATLYGGILKSLVQRIQEMIDERIKLLPKKAVKFGFLQ